MQRKDWKTCTQHALTTWTCCGSPSSQVRLWVQIDARVWSCLERGSRMRLMSSTTFRFILALSSRSGENDWRFVGVWRGKINIVPRLYPVLLCGGSGTSLRPLSRRSCPKQFAKFGDGETLFQAGVRRLVGPNVVPPVMCRQQSRPTAPLAGRMTQAAHEEGMHSSRKPAEDAWTSFLQQGLWSRSPTI